MMAVIRPATIHLQNLAIFNEARFDERMLLLPRQKWNEAKLSFERDI